MTPAASAISTGRRYLALWFPYLPIDRLRLSSPGDKPDEPLLLVAKDGNALRVSAACPRARSLGLLPGMPLADARAQVPCAMVREADPGADASLLLHLARMAGRWSPMVAPDPPDGLLIDISGCAHLFGGEAALVAEVVARLGRKMTVRPALASNPAAAGALARFPSDHADEAEAVRRLPVAALGLDGDATAALRRAGLKQVGDLADRPTAPLAARFGEAATAALDQLLGRRDSRITPLRPLPALHFARRFAEPVGHAEAVEAALAGLADEAAVALRQRHQGGRCFLVSLHRADGAVRELAVGTGRPTRDPALIARLFRERIASLADPLDPGFGFDLIRLDLPATEALTPTQSDLDRRAEGGEALDALVDRLSVRHGRGRIRRLTRVNTHVPERAVCAVPALDCRQPAPWPSPPPGEPPLRPLCLFDPPQPVDAIAEVPDAPPRRFLWRGAAHHVVRAEGPERIAAPWWRKSGEGRPTRDYYRVEDSEGRRFWLFRHGLFEREATQPRWYIHGLLP